MSARRCAAPAAGALAALATAACAAGPIEPVIEVTLAAHRARVERVYGDAPPRQAASSLVRDSRGREWYHRAVALESGASFSHYSRPIDARRGLAVTSFTTRAPDRIAARDAIDRASIAAERE